MEIKATVLCENYVMFNEGAVAEHGWAVFLETEDGNYLFDTGQGKALINNARVFKKDLSSLKGIILSHHHYDHTGGLLEVLLVSGPVDVYSHPDLFKESYSLRREEKPLHIGVPFRREVLENAGANFCFNRDWREIAAGIYLTGEVPRRTKFEKGDDKLAVMTKEGLVKDNLLDDQSLVIESCDGIYIILGCAHSGVINTIMYAIERTGKERIKALIGGTHLGAVSEEQMEMSIKALKDFNIERIGVSHCTGLKASLRLLQEFGEKFFFCNVGSLIEMKC